MQEFNVYCDESNHLENDNSNIMTLGAVYVEKQYVRQINEEIRHIKIKHNIHVNDELKWTKISNKRLPVYSDLVRYYFDNDFLFSRTIIIPNKKGLEHERFQQSHDDWYYKMHYGLVEYIVKRNSKYNIYLDYKDTHMFYKGKELHRVLNNKVWKFKNVEIKKVQPIRSHEVEIMQIVDILIGAIAYKNKGLTTSNAKLQIIKLIEELSNQNLKYQSTLREKKLNRFIWDIAGDSRDM